MLRLEPSTVQAHLLHLAFIGVLQVGLDEPLSMEAWIAPAQEKPPMPRLAAAGDTRTDCFHYRGQDRAGRSVSVKTVSREPTKIRSRRLCHPREHLVVPASLIAQRPGQGKLTVASRQMDGVPHIHDSSAAVTKSQKEVRHMATDTISPFRPQHSKRLGRDPDNVPVIPGKHQEIPIQQTLKAHMRARRAGPPRTLLIPLAGPGKEGTDRQLRFQALRCASRQHRLIQDASIYRARIRAESVAFGAALAV
jgi:hypothetical protein